MNDKIVLNQVFLLNWYGFSEPTVVPLARNATLITGANRSGKSVLLDAIKYAFMGDTEFNKSANSKEKTERTLTGYVRGELADEGNSLFMRGYKEMKEVNAHVCLEWYDEVNDCFFLTGVIICSQAERERTISYWYTKDNCTIKKDMFCDINGTTMFVFDKSRFKEKNNPVFYEKKADAMAEFSKKTGLKLGIDHSGDYAKRMRRLITYNPECSIGEFMKNSILEPKNNIDFQKLIENQHQIESIKAKLKELEEESLLIDEILLLYKKYEAEKRLLEINECKISYKEYLDAKDRKEALDNDIYVLKNTIVSLEKHLSEVEINLSQAKTQEINANNEFLSLDGSQALSKIENELGECVQKIKLLQSEKEKFLSFQETIIKALGCLKYNSISYLGDKTLLNLSDSSVETEKKILALKELRKALDEETEHMAFKCYEMSTKLKNISSLIIEKKKSLSSMRKNINDFSMAREQLLLIREINSAFEKENIVSEAKMACQYVISVKDDEWRDVIEAFLNKHRFAVLVEPKYFNVANKVFDSSKYHHVELVNTPLLLKKTLRNTEGLPSVCDLLEIKDEIAFKYFNYLLGGLVACDLDEVAKHENALSKEGKLSRNMALTFVDKTKCGIYCLGLETFKLNISLLERQIADLEESEKSLLSELSQSEKIKSELSGYKDFISKDISFDTLESLDKEEQNRALLNNKKKELEKSLEKDETFLALERRYKDAISHRENIEKELFETKESLQIKKTSCKEKEKNVNVAQIHLNEMENLYLQKKVENREYMEEAILQYLRFLKGETTTGNVNAPDTIAKRQKEISVCVQEILSRQIPYLKNKSFPDISNVSSVEVSTHSFLEQRKKRIIMDNKADAQRQLTEEQERYFNTFRRNFVLQIYHNYKNAKEQLKFINKELAEIDFSPKYKFAIDFKKDMSNYAKIMEYAEKLEETNYSDDPQMTLFSTSYSENEISKMEEEVQKILREIIDSADKEKSAVEILSNYADYRNYLNVDIMVTESDGRRYSLTKKQGKDSGAGVQIPYTLVLICSLTMIYNARGNSARLAFFDEPFAKMDFINVDLMMRFFKRQNLQVVLCAPNPSLIGEHAQNLITIKKKNGKMRAQIIIFN